MKRRDRRWWSGAFIGTAVIGIAVFLYLGVPSGPRYFRLSGRLARLQPERRLVDEIVPAPTGTEGAEHAYHRAVLALGDKSVTPPLDERPDRPSSREDAEFPTGITELLLAGAGQREMAYHNRYVPAEELMAEDGAPHWQKFIEIAEIANLRARLHLKHGRTKETEALYQATVIFGHHILSDRVRYEGLITGLTVQQIGLQGLFQFYSAAGDHQRADKVRRYSDSLLELERQFDEKARNTIYRLPMPVGDLIIMAKNDRDRAFRVEAIRRLGYARWTRYATRGDRRVIRRLLSTLLEDDDPHIRAAARWAADRTTIEVRQLK